MGPGFESLEVHHLHSSLAQLAERVTVNHDVVGSSPTGGAKKKVAHSGDLLFTFSEEREPSTEGLTQNKTGSGAIR